MNHVLSGSGDERVNVFLIFRQMKISLAPSAQICDDPCDIDRVVALGSVFGLALIDPTPKKIPTWKEYERISQYHSQQDLKDSLYWFGFDLIVHRTQGQLV
ncbi:hypothetical protein N7504_010399 [Penicillium tannophilum]|nr:hypothetical protein N7504_010399 [Penicillium tannophilum]